MLRGRRSVSTPPVKVQCARLLYGAPLVQPRTWLRQMGVRCPCTACAQRCSHLSTLMAPPARMLTSQPIPPRMHGREKSPSPLQAVLSTLPLCPPPSQGKAKMYQTFQLEGQWSAPRLPPVRASVPLPAAHRGGRRRPQF